MANPKVKIFVAIFSLICVLPCDSKPWRDPAEAPCELACACDGLSFMNCSSSGLSSLPKTVPCWVRTLDLTYNHFASVFLPAREGETWKARDLQLGHSKISHLFLCWWHEVHEEEQRGDFRIDVGRNCAPDVEILSVRDNMLRNLPKGLQHLSSLRALDLSHNKITEILEEDLHNCKSLTSLYLQNNHLSTIHPESFKTTRNLKVLNLSNNRLANIPATVVTTLSNLLVEFEVSNNEWICDCRLLPLKRLASPLLKDRRGAQHIFCKKPSHLSGWDLLTMQDSELICEGIDDQHTTVLYEVMVYAGQKLVLTCCDTLKKNCTLENWWTPHGRVSKRKGKSMWLSWERSLIVRNINDTDGGLYVCIAGGTQKMISITNVQIEKNNSGAAVRKVRNVEPLPRQRTQSEFILAVCLSVVITFICSFVLGLLARPFLERLWKKIRPQKMSASEHVYENNAFTEGTEINDEKERMELAGVSQGQAKNNSEPLTNLHLVPIHSTTSDPEQKQHVPANATEKHCKADPSSQISKPYPVLNEISQPLGAADDQIKINSLTSTSLEDVSLDDSGSDSSPEMNDKYKNKCIRVKVQMESPKDIKPNDHVVQETIESDKDSTNSDMNFRYIYETSYNSPRYPEETLCAQIVSFQKNLTDQDPDIIKTINSELVCEMNKEEGDSPGNLGEEHFLNDSYCMQPDIKNESWIDLVGTVRDEGGEQDFYSQVTFSKVKVDDINIYNVYSDFPQSHHCEKIILTDEDSENEQDTLSDEFTFLHDKKIHEAQGNCSHELTTSVDLDRIVHNPLKDDQLTDSYILKTDWSPHENAHVPQPQWQTVKLNDENKENYNALQQRYLGEDKPSEKMQDSIIHSAVSEAHISDHLKWTSRFDWPVLTETRALLRCNTYTERFPVVHNEGEFIESAPSISNQQLLSISGKNTETKNVSSGINEELEDFKWAAFDNSNWDNTGESLFSELGKDGEHLEVRKEKIGKDLSEDRVRIDREVITETQDINYNIRGTQSDSSGSTPSPPLRKNSLTKSTLGLKEAARPNSDNCNQLKGLFGVTAWDNMTWSEQHAGESECEYSKHMSDCTTDITVLQDTATNIWSISSVSDKKTKMNDKTLNPEGFSCSKLDKMLDCEDDTIIETTFRGLCGSEIHLESADNENINTPQTFIETLNECQRCSSYDNRLDLGCDHFYSDEENLGEILNNLFSSTKENKPEPEVNTSSLPPEHHTFLLQSAQEDGSDV
ncbi:uncharacterized protein LOC127528013 [Erpetoichthys calabaricus]|uniref:uncharacterized protein LOC127528013 n=1 Tax=Erpetoichthys calabaricus TaxID=27687 RepID=UPI00223497E0|nr:uncharacterized protein LOC127528013 [Erpetoichthys calabaricus]